MKFVMLWMCLLAALFTAAAVELLETTARVVDSWKQTPAQRRNLDAATWNAASAAYQGSLAAANLEAATRPLRDPDTGLAPTLVSFAASASSAASSLNEFSGKLTVIEDSVNSQVKAVGDKAVEVEASLEPVSVNAASLLSNVNAGIEDARAEAPVLLAAVEPALSDGKAFMKSARAIGDQVADTAPLFLDCEGNQDCIYNRFQGIAKAIEEASVAGKKTSIATQHTMENFAAASKPLPTWLRIVLGIGPPVAQMGAAAASAGSILGWIK